jgi:ParB family chromosome partitioning protein
LGLKKPIQVSKRSPKEEAETGYDLVCGQVRLEAFFALNFTEIPAEVVEIPKEERLLRSLVENMARRFPAPSALIDEIQRLKAQGDTNTLIAKKLDISDTAIGGLISLNKHGEARLLDAALRGIIPLGVAVDIAKADSPETQRELLKAYEKKQLNQVSIRTIKRLIEQRQFFGKERNSEKGPSKQRSADGLVSAYRREGQRQKLLVRKARICESKLLFIVTAFKALLADENFVNLLRAEGLATIPKYLAEKIRGGLKEAA